MEYAIRIDGKYFNEYIYADKDISGRIGKVNIQEGDIINITLTDEIERTEIKRSVGNTISTLYSIESIQDKKIEIIPCCRCQQHGQEVTMIANTLEISKPFKTNEIEIRLKVVDNYSNLQELTKALEII